VSLDPWSRKESAHDPPVEPAAAVVEAPRFTG